MTQDNSKAATANPALSSTAYYHITSVGASKAISHTPNGALNYAVGWTVDNNDSKQLWAFIPFIHPLTYRLRVKLTDRVLDLSQASSANGTLALAYGQHTATTKRNQLWWLPIKPGNEGYTIQCLETSTVADMRTSDNGIIGWRSHGGRNQQWKMNTLDELVVSAPRIALSQTFANNLVVVIRRSRTFLAGL
jgi:hypothetical protein